ncbi:MULTISPECIES: hypothetical protein [unclassified Streptomyces]|uniref:hypothetical protein n=1 Tax=unclassified Streptomyces TaxID=2593676 RepID=UPI00081DB351|nr:MULTISPECIES: hypothetical protein [unclassified Streptomyces]MYZ35258.1 hypothetical protein [Streptomyces sp. SID4917]SCF74024.1 hypothetical protein GA0115259_101887 [Streptomyces sp. MnatMP-M17]
MAHRVGIGRCAVLLLTVASAASALTGCSVLEAGLDRGCENTESRVKELESHDILDSRPEGTVVPQGFEDLESGCWADSGDASVYADRTYVFPGDKAEVTRYYRAAAERDGWELSQTSAKSSKVEQAADLCFTLDKRDSTTMLDVYFLTEEILDEEGRKPGPEFNSGSGYRVSITSPADGSTISCSD